MLNPRLDQLGAYAFRRLAALLDGSAAPADLRPIDLSIGEPRHAVPALVAETIAAHAAAWNRYPPVNGTSAFREAVASWLGRRYDPASVLDPDRHILPVAGTKEALYLLAQAVVPERKGGGRPAVLVPNPFYNVYFGAALMAGAEPVFLPATAETGFLPDLDALDGDLLGRTAALYLCSPANPQGVAADETYWRRALELARAHDFVLVADECYSEIWDRAPPAGALAAAAASDCGFGNLIAMHSLSKRSCAAGLRSGFVAGDPALIAAFARLRSFAAAVQPLPVMAAATALWGDEAHVEANRTLYRAKFDTAERLFAGRLGFYRPDGGFFLWLDVGDGEAAALRSWREAGVKTLPGAYLGRPQADGANPGAGYLRLALVDPPDLVEDALERVARVLA
jgi:aspartate/methionine/tyrosine aminotransferase